MVPMLGGTQYRHLSLAALPFSGSVAAVFGAGARQNKGAVLVPAD